MGAGTGAASGAGSGAASAAPATGVLRDRLLMLLLESTKALCQNL